MEIINFGFIKIDKDTALNLDRVDYIKNTNGHLDFHMGSGEVCSTTYSGLDEFFHELGELQKQAYCKAVESAKDEFRIISKNS